MGWAVALCGPGTLPFFLSTRSESQRLNYGQNIRNMQTNMKQDFLSSVRTNVLLSHTDVKLSNSCYGKMYFILGRFLPGRSIIDLLLLSHMVQRLGMDDSYFWPTTFKLCFRLFGKCETAHLHGSKLGLCYCCFGEGDSLGVYRTSIETPCGPNKMWIWTSISGAYERHSQQMLESEIDEVQTSGSTSSKHFFQKRKKRK